MRRDDAGGEILQSFASGPQFTRRVAASIALVCVGYVSPGQAERWTLLPSVDTRATWTNNVSFEERGVKQSDTILELLPSLTLLGEGKRFRIGGTIGADAIGYVNGTRDNRVLPIADLTANLEAIERRFFVEAGVVTRQAAQDVFGPRPDGGANFNTVTTTQYRIVPTLEGRLGPDVKYRIRSSNSWTETSDAQIQQDAAYLGDHSLRVERAPTPLGWALEVARSDTRFESGTPSSAVVDSGRLSLLYAFTPEFNLGLRAGYEKTNLLITDGQERIYGVESNWRPSQRTNLSAFWEHRFFGSGWNLQFSHRMPRLAWNIALARTLASFPQAFFTLGPTNNVANLLDAAFTTRIPDAAQRSRFIADLIARQGLPSSLVSETSLFSQKVSIVQSRTASVAYLGATRVIALNAFRSRTEDVPDSIFLAGGTTLNVEQSGVSLTFSNQMTSLTSLNVTGGQTWTQGLGADAGTESRQTLFRAQVTRQLAPKTTAFMGARVQKFRQKSSGVDGGPVRESAGFVGLGHRF